MFLLNLIGRLFRYLDNKQLKDFEKKHPSRFEQDRFLKRIGTGSNFFENSYNKFKCVCFYHYSPFVIMVYNLGSLLLLIPLYVFFNRKKLKLADKDETKVVLRSFRSVGSEHIPVKPDDIFPEVLKCKYKVCDVVSTINCIFLDKESNSILLQAAKRHPFSFYYLLVLMKRLARQSTIIHNENPKIICTYVCEREFADPLLTYYSSLFNVEYHGFMHGDFMYQIDHAFMQFSCYWVWDEHYRKMFQNLKCNQKMIVYKPHKYEPLNISIRAENECNYFATYYFSGESKISINVLKRIFDQLYVKGKVCKVRPHPRHSNYEYIKNIFIDYYIEDTKTCSLETSLENSYFIIALNSTVLSQAYYSGKIIVIDDITNKEAYNELCEKDYILIDKAQYRFSEILKIYGVKL